MSLTREIPRNVIPPTLSTEAITLLTQLCFMPEPDYQKVDLIFVFGNQDFEAIANQVQDLLQHGIANQIIITGGWPYPSDLIENKRPESEEILARVNPANYPQANFQIESTSRNTLENVKNAMEAFPDLMSVESMFYIFRTHASRRAFLSLKKFIPATELLFRGVPGTRLDTQRLITKDEWFLSNEGQGRVWGECLRLKLYGERGDIAYDLETKNLVDQIMTATS